MTTWGGGGQFIEPQGMEDIREALSDAALAVWKNVEAHEQGAELTAAGGVIFRQLAHRRPPEVCRCGNRACRHV